MMRLGLSAVVAMGLGLIAAAPAAAEGQPVSWTLWQNDTWEVRPFRSVGEYPDQAACLAASKPATEVRANQVALEARAQDGNAWWVDEAARTKTMVTLGQPQLVKTPPGTRMVVRVTRSSPTMAPAGPRVIVVTQCWPTGTSPE